ncbi:MAG: N-acetyltransferase [Pseudomonadota bacterium]
MTHASFQVTPAADSDAAAITALHALVFGPGRFARTAFRVREGTPPVSAHCQMAVAPGQRGGVQGRQQRGEQGGPLLGAVRMTDVTISGAAGFAMLGPICVVPDRQGETIGAALLAAAVDSAFTAGLHGVILIGDPPYYERLGAHRLAPGLVTFPGPVDPARVVAFLRGAVQIPRGAVRAAI